MLRKTTSFDRQAGDELALEAEQSVISGAEVAALGELPGALVHGGADGGVFLERAAHEGDVLKLVMPGSVEEIEVIRVSYPRSTEAT